MTGCITTGNGSYLGFKRTTTKGIKVPSTPMKWIKTRSCTPESYIKVLENGILKELMTDRCLAMEDWLGDEEGSV